MYVMIDKSNLNQEHRYPDRYATFYRVVDEVMTDLESYVPSGETKPKRKVSGSQRDKLRLSIASVPHLT